MTLPMQFTNEVSIASQYDVDSQLMSQDINSKTRNKLYEGISAPQFKKNISNKIMPAGPKISTINSHQFTVKPLSQIRSRFNRLDQEHLNLNKCTILTSKSAKFLPPPLPQPPSYSIKIYSKESSLLQLGERRPEITQNRTILSTCRSRAIPTISTEIQFNRRKNFEKEMSLSSTNFTIPHLKRLLKRERSSEQEVNKTLNRSFREFRNQNETNYYKLMI